MFYLRDNRTPGQSTQNHSLVNAVVPFTDRELFEGNVVGESRIEGDATEHLPLIGSSSDEENG